MCDVQVMEAFVMKYIDESELHVAVYPTRQKLWRFIKCESRLPSLLEYFGQNFCHVLEKHLTGREGFSRFLAAWYKFTSKIASASMADTAASHEWSTAAGGFTEHVSKDDWSALMSAIATAMYTFMQKQVYIHI